MISKVAAAAALRAATGSFARLLLGGAALAALAGCEGGELAESVRAEPSAMRVRGVAIERESIDVSPVLIGTLEPLESAVLRARQDGMLVSLTVDVGDRVTRGQLLGVIEIPGLSPRQRAALASIESARSEASLRSEEAERAQAITARSPDAIAPEEAAAATRAAEIASARADVRIAEAAQLRALATDARIVAPWDGVVVARRLDPGSGVENGAAILELARVDTYRLTFGVPESVLPLARIGAPVEFVIEGASPRAATVTRLGAALDARTGQLRAEVELPGDAALVVGVHARIRFTDATRDALLAPADAILIEGTEPVTYVDDDGVARRRVLVLGHDDGARVEIASGLAEGDILLIGGRGLLRDGTAVEVVQ